MKAGPVYALVVYMLYICAAAAQESAAVEPYDADEAYQVYSVLLPHEESYVSAKSTLVIQEETVSDRRADDVCLSAEAAEEFKEAISDFNRVNSKRWILQRRFQIEQPYEIVSSDTIRLFFDHGQAWNDFYKRYPGSGGFFIMSAVGFNKEKNKAIVYMGRNCGWRCGLWSFHILEKVGGKWQEAPGFRCLPLMSSNTRLTGSLQACLRCSRIVVAAGKFTYCSE